MENNKSISVTVCYVQAHQQEVIAITLPPQTKVLQAIKESGILDKCPEVDLSKNDVGIFGKTVRLDQVLLDKDRVEIYQPLLLSPMEARRQRAKQGKL